MEVGDAGDLAILTALGQEAVAASAQSVNPEAGNHAPAQPVQDIDNDSALLEALKAEETAETQVAEPQPETKPADTAKAEAKAVEKPEPTRDEKSDKRANEAWEKVNAEKARLEAERKQFEEQRKQSEASKYSPEDYEALAKEFEDEGRDDLAKTARAKGQELRESNQRAEAEKSIRAFEDQRNSVIKDVVARHPDLLKPESEQFRMTEAFIKARPELAHFPRGFEIAAEAVAAKLKADGVSKLEQEVGELRKQLADRDRLLQPGLGLPSATTRATDFNSLPDAEQENRLLAALRSAEQGGVVTW